MMIFSGSRSNVPKMPLGARVSTSPRNIRFCLPETSTKPPDEGVGCGGWGMGAALPRALMLPKNWVVSSAQRMTRPPSPPPSRDCRASAKIEVSASTKVTRALGRGPCPRKLPPIKILPPPSVPEASRVASKSPMRSPKIRTVEEETSGKLPETSDISPSATSTVPETIASPVCGTMGVCEPTKLNEPSGLTVTEEA